MLDSLVWQRRTAEPKLTTRIYRMEGPKEYRQIGVQEPTGVAVSKHHFAWWKYTQRRKCRRAYRSAAGRQGTGVTLDQVGHPSKQGLAGCRHKGSSV